MGGPQKSELRPAIVTELNVNGLAVVRALGRQGVPVIGITTRPDAPECTSRHLARVVAREPGKAALVETLRSLAREFAAGGAPRPAGQAEPSHSGSRAHDRLDARPLLFPITDESVETIAEHHAELCDAFVVPMSDPELVLRLLDKRGFDELAREHGLPVPETFDVATREEVERAGRELRMPVILKPFVKSSALAAAGAKKAYVLETPEALLETWERFADVEPRWIVQRFVPGSDADVYFCLQYYDQSGEPSASFCGRKLRQWPPECGGTAVAEASDASEPVELATRFFRAVGFRGGIVSMEYKRDSRDGSYWLIEPTVCRTDWQSALADANGLPIAWIAYCDQLGMPKPKLPAAGRRVRWLHFGDDRKAASVLRERGELGRLAWIRSLRPPFRGAYWSLEDWRPFWTIFKRSVAAKLRPRRDQLD